MTSTIAKRSDEAGLGVDGEPPSVFKKMRGDGAYKKCGRDQGDTNEYKDDQQRANLIARIGHKNAPMTAALARLAPRFGTVEPGPAATWVSIATNPPANRTPSTMESS